MEANDPVGLDRHESHATGRNGLTKGGRGVGWVQPRRPEALGGNNVADVETKLSTAEKVARVREAYQASERGDLEKGVEILAEDCLLYTSPSPRD